MFSGIIQSIGTITSLEKRALDLRIEIDIGKLAMESIALGDSIAVNGVCLTAVELGSHRFAADVSNETLACTTLKDFCVAMPVNLELALTPTTRIGGHFVSGHVDGIGVIRKRFADGRSQRFEIGMPQDLARYIAAKGSICVDGVSLTVNQVESECFGVNIVPHTLSETTLGQAMPGRRVNLEVDLLSRYLERLLCERNPDGGPLSWETLKKAGFL